MSPYDVTGSQWGKTGSASFNDSIWAHEGYETVVGQLKRNKICQTLTHAPGLRMSVYRYKNMYLQPQWLPSTPKWLSSIYSLHIDINNWMKSTSNSYLFSVIFVTFAIYYY